MCKLSVRRCLTTSSDGKCIENVAIIVLVLCPVCGSLEDTERNVMFCKTWEVSCGISCGISCPTAKMKSCSICFAVHDCCEVFKLAQIE